MNTVRSERLQYTPSSFARTSLLHLTETGTLTALKPHTSSRENLGGFLLFAVEQGSGMVEICDHRYFMVPGDVAFIDCSRPYSHSTPAYFATIGSVDENGKLSDSKGEKLDSSSFKSRKLENCLWTISWVHFNGSSMPDIYNKFLQRSGKPIFHSSSDYISLLQNLYHTANGESYVRDMVINTELCKLLTRVMEDCWCEGRGNTFCGKKGMDLLDVKAYLNEHYMDKIRLDDLGNMFFIDRSYLSRAFKKLFGINLMDYLTIIRINKVKELLRFGVDGREAKMIEIAELTGFGSEQHLSTRFKQVEGCSPREYRNKWK